MMVILIEKEKKFENEGCTVHYTSKKFFKYNFWWVCLKDSNSTKKPAFTHSKLFCLKNLQKFRKTSFKTNGRGNLNHLFFARYYVAVSFIERKARIFDWKKNLSCLSGENSRCPSFSFFSSYELFARTK